MSNIVHSNSKFDHGAPSPGTEVGLVYCSVLQRVAACCSVLQCVVVRCSVLHCAWGTFARLLLCCSALQHGAACCIWLQCAKVCWNMLQCVAVCYRLFWCVLKYVAVCYRVFWCVAVDCSQLQCDQVAVCFKDPISDASLRYAIFNLCHMYDWVMTYVTLWLP